MAHGALRARPPHLPSVLSSAAFVSSVTSAPFSLNDRMKSPCRPATEASTITACAGSRPCACRCSSFRYALSPERMTCPNGVQTARRNGMISATTAFRIPFLFHRSYHMKQKDQLTCLPYTSEVLTSNGQPDPRTFVSPHPNTGLSSAESAGLSRLHSLTESVDPLAAKSRQSAGAGLDNRQISTHARGRKRQPPDHRIRAVFDQSVLDPGFAELGERPLVLLQDILLQFGQLDCQLPQPFDSRMPRRCCFPH